MKDLSIQVATDISKVLLPREAHYGSRFVEDLQTYLVAQGGFKATITGYDKEYKKTKRKDVSTIKSRKN